jgi:hypothetical protein
MAAKRLRIPCPNCRNRLHIRVEDIGRKGECRYCGHQFRAMPKPAVEALVRAPGARETQRVDGGQERAGVPSRPGRKVRPSRSFTSPGWHGVVEPPDEALAVDLVDDDQVVVRFEDADSRPAAAHPDPIGRAGKSVALTAANGGRFELAGTGTDIFQFGGEVAAVATSHTTSASEIAQQVVRLVLERDESQAECARLRYAIELLQLELGQQLSEVSRLRKTAEKLKAVRAERDRLNAERAVLVREAAELQTRLVETQVTLVEVEEELEEARSHARSERREWEERSRASEHRLADLRSRLAGAGNAATPDPDPDRPAETHEFDATIEDLEVVPCGVSAGN